MKLILSTIILLTLSSIAIGQSPANISLEPQNQRQEKTQPQVVDKNNLGSISPDSPELLEINPAQAKTQVALPVSELQEVLVMINGKKPSQILVYKASGEWWSSVRELSVRFDIESGTIVGSTTAWKGPIKPSIPIRLNVKIIEIKSATEKQFDLKLVELNSKN